MSIQECPTLRPTQQQFNNFSSYVQELDKTYSSEYAMVKVIPPSNWRPTSFGYSNFENGIIQGPIQQNAYGKGGAYECLHIQKKSMTIREYKRKISCFENVTNDLEFQDVQNLFWKNISFSPPLYGADIKLSFMNQVAGEWNMNTLKSFLSAGLKHKLAGVNTPYCYIGSWKTLFCWHTEDMQLSAINFLHLGKPKFWYGVCKTDKHLLQNQAKIYFSQNFKKCPEYMRHKTCIINPYILKQKNKGLKITKILQKPGQFVLIFGGSYHCGFNFGFNLAQAVNYATSSWLKQFFYSNYCTCRKDSVKISLKQMYLNLQNSELKNQEKVIQFGNLIALQEKEQEQRKEIESSKKKVDKKQQEQNLTRLFRKKIIKKKVHNQIKVKGEKYLIDTWAQCQKCNKWRKIYKNLKKNEYFQCSMIGSDCYRRQQSSSEYINLTKY